MALLLGDAWRSEDWTQPGSASVIAEVKWSDSSVASNSTVESHAAPPILPKATSEALRDGAKVGPKLRCAGGKLHHSGSCTDKRDVRRWETEVWQSLEQRQVIHTFKLGKMGISYDDNGLVKEVFDNGPARIKGIQKGSRIVKVDDARFSKASLVAAEESGVHYKVTFEGPRKQTLPSTLASNGSVALARTLEFERLKGSPVSETEAADAEARAKERRKNRLKEAQEIEEANAAKRAANYAAKKAGATKVRSDYERRLRAEAALQAEKEKAEEEEAIRDIMAQREENKKKSNITDDANMHLFMNADDDADAFLGPKITDHPDRTASLKAKAKAVIAAEREQHDDKILELKFSKASPRSSEAKDDEAMYRIMGSRIADSKDDAVMHRFMGPRSAESKDDALMHRFMGPRSAESKDDALMHRFMGPRSAESKDDALMHRFMGPRSAESKDDALMHRFMGPRSAESKDDEVMHRVMASPRFGTATLDSLSGTQQSGFGNAFGFFSASLGQTSQSKRDDKLLERLMSGTSVQPQGVRPNFQSSQWDTSRDLLACLQPDSHAPGFSSSASKSMAFDPREAYAAASRARGSSVADMQTIQDDYLLHCLVGDHTAPQSGPSLGHPTAQLSQDLSAAFNLLNSSMSVQSVLDVDVVNNLMGHAARPAYGSLDKQAQLSQDTSVLCHLMEDRPCTPSSLRDVSVINQLMGSP